jgi:hypothetical protein
VKVEVAEDKAKPFSVMHHDQADQWRDEPLGAIDEAT